MCPYCKGELSFFDEGVFECNECRIKFNSSFGIPVFINQNSRPSIEVVDRSDFWNQGWEKRNSSLLSMDRTSIIKERDLYLDYLKKEEYPSVTIFSEDKLRGKSFLNIGCGGGYEGLLFSGFGANYVGIDFSFNAAHFTTRLIEKAGQRGTTYQAEAEYLPFKNDSFDFVYSSGVLHHTPNTQETLMEVYRVLRPGGEAIIGLYATFSIMFLWYRLHAILRGNVTRKAIGSWMNSNTEGDWKVGSSENKWTKTYSKMEFIRLMETANFSQIEIQQTQQQIKNIPLIGRLTKWVLPSIVGDLKIGPFGSMLVVKCIKRAE